MNRKHWLIIIMTLLYGTVTAQPNLYLTDRFSKRANSDQIVAGGYAGFFMTLAHDKWQDMKKPSGSGLGTDYKLKSVQDIIRLGVNHDTAAAPGAFRYQINLRVDAYKYSAPTTAVTTYPSLKVSFDPDSLDSYLDLSVHKFSGYDSFKVSIVSIMNLNTGAAVVVGSFVRNLYMEAEIATQRYDLTAVNLATRCDAEESGRRLAVKWNLYTGSAPCPLPVSYSVLPYKPVSYELEWTYIDDYQYDLNTGTKSYAFGTSSTIPYDFRRNSTRILVNGNLYRIPMVYEHGALVYRVRTVRPDPVNYKGLVYGAWSLPDFGTTLAANASCFPAQGYRITSGHTSDSLNWQYNINFAEEGKYKNVVNYYDGALKDRQTQTRINTDTSYTVLVDKVYDYEGRPALSSLPTPVFNHKNLYYRKDLLLNQATGKAYTAADFDGLRCGIPDSIVPLSNAAMANIYYSSLNTDKTGMQKYVPDAKGYPMVQTMYSPDNTNKVLYQGGAGRELQLWKGHATQYEYARPMQEEIDRLLGTEAGKSAFYPKQVVTDPNGQASFSIMDQQGKVVASGLQGDGPDTSKVPVDSLVNFARGKSVCSDLLREAAQDRTGDGINAVTTLYNDNKANTSFKYSVATFPFPTGCNSKYLWAKADYNYTITNDCGTDAVNSSGSAGKDSVSSVNGSAYSNGSTITVSNMPKGKYQVNKQLSFSSRNIRRQVDSFVKANEPTCYNDQKYFVRKAVEAAVFPCNDTAGSPRTPCDLLKQKMMRELYPGGKYGQYYTDSNGSFADGPANSIFSTTSGVGGLKTINASGTAGDNVTSLNAGDRDMYWTFSYNKINYAPAIVYDHPWRSIATARFISSDNWERAASLLPGNAKPPEPDGHTFFKAMIDIDSSVVLDSVVLANFAMDGDYVKMLINDTMVFDYSVGWLLGIPRKLPYLKYGTNKIEFYIHNSVGPMAFYSLIATKKQGYRYQDACVNMPESITSDGNVYANLKGLPQDVFIRIFNDQIAEALLPLHPEYCKLQLCNDGGAFEEKLDNIETWQQAVAANLFNLDSITKQDPIKGVGSGGPERLKRLRGISTRMDTLALQQAYCGAGNGEEKAYCTAFNYKTQIDNFSFVNDTVRQNYFDILRAAYLGNRGLVLRELYDSVNNTCPSCAARRMTLVTPPAPVFKPLDSLLSNSYDWTGQSTGPDSDNADASGDMPDWIKELYRKAKNKDSSGMSSVPPGVSDSMAMVNNTLNTIQADALISHLQNCSLNPVTLARIRSSAMNVLGSGKKLTPQIVKSILTDTAALTLNDLCHPFLVAYDFLPERTDIPANYACGDPVLYNGLLSFLQRSQVLAEINTAPTLGAPGWTTSSGSFALSGANAYESQLGASATVTAVLENVPSVCSGCYVSLYIAGATRTDTLHIIAQKSGSMPNIQGRLSGGGGYTLSAVRCLSDDPQAMVSGLVARQTAILDASCSLCILPSRYYIWSRKTNFMTPAPSAASLANAITCPDLKNALDSFKADTVLYKYTEATNHPLFENTLTNYLNYKFGKKYKYSDYSQLMEGCAVTDKVTLKQFLASYRIQFNSDVNAETFIIGLNNLGTLRPRYVRYKSTADTSPVLLIDFNSIGQDTLLAYKSWIDGYSGSGVLNRSYNYSDASNNTSLVLSRSSCGFTPGTYAPVATTTSNVSVWEGEGYNSGYKLHSFRLSSGTALDEANLVASVQAYLYGGTADPICNSGYNFFGRTLLRSDDYGSTLKQQYLSYVYSLGTNHSVVIAGIDPTVLGSQLASYSSGYNFTYDNPYCAGSRNSVYAYKTSPATGATGYNLVKNTILPSVGSLLFPNKDTTLKTPLAGNALTVIRKANGDYWYRYFDATNTLYNVYISSPNRGLGIKPELYSFVSVSMGADARTFTVMVSNGTNSIRCRGYADFDLSASSFVARNVILDQGKWGMSCFDSLDCEYGVMANAILNGKATYARYFDSATTRISKDMMAHLLSTTKDSLVYCGTRQQYQYTLYYYDQAGNLTRTVPPEGVRTIAEGSLGTVKDTRNGIGGSPDTRLTSHQKQSVYRYNALNQLVYQQTPDGGITYFFYDAAGRQRFSQNSRQRPLGLYTYSLYDGQGRPMETGEVKLSCDKTTDLLFDTSFCDYYTPAGTLYRATHPDFVARAYDNANYPDDTLNRYVRSRQRQEVVRTVYDTTIKVILVAGGISLPLDGLSAEHLDAQQNLRSRVSAIMYYPNIMSGVISPEQPQFGTYYSYDYNGNVKTINHDFPQLNAQGQRFKRIDYDYDLISGKINMLSHNRNRPDQFYQRYSYDADNRITGVETSHDGLIWNKDAAYTYYKHGPLATVKIGDKIQSMEYAYTVQGWLKAINTDVLNTGKDMGRNGAAGDLTYSRDVLAHALHYFQDDYKQISTTAGETAVNLPQPAKSLYNGNITQQTTGIGGLGTMQRNYRYDQLQRLKSAVNANVNDATAALVATPLNLYRSSYSYDMDGNILGLRRYNGGVTPGLIDNFAYSYEGGGNNNKLLRVFDTVTTTGGGNDLQHGQASINYIYDKTGNLVFDQQGAERISWDHFGKVKTIKDTISNRFINFVYDGQGNRIFKEVSKTGSTDDRSGEYYVRDATGNILSVYRTHSVFNKWSVITGYTASVSTTGLISLADLLRPLKNTSFPVGLTSEILSSHSGWVDAYTTRPVSYYLAADAGLKASLLFSGSSWIDDLRSADLGNNTTVWRQTMMDAGPDMVPMFQAALNLPPEGTRLLEQFSMNMPVPVCANLWMMAGQQYMPGNHTMNANNLYAPLSMDPGMRNMVGQEISNNLMNDIPMNGGVNSAAFYDAVVADNSLFLSPALRGQQGQWTGQLSNIVNQYTPVGVVGNFFDTWPGGQGALTAATTPSYRLGIVYNAGPDQAFNDMLGEATEPDVNNILTGMTDFTPAEYASMIISAGAASATDLYTRPGVLNDTISLAEHHIYGSSRLGVQRCDSLALSNNRANSNTRFDLNRQVPWYSYTFDDRIDSTKKEPYGTAGNTDNSIFNNSRFIGLKYYELTDHLGNVLATVLDRKTGKIGGTPGLYDRWVADIASTADYYPGGMMMGGRNTESRWSRMGYNGKEKDDEVYGKGNFQDYGFRGLDNRLVRFWSVDPLTKQFPWYTPYQFAGNSTIQAIDLDGAEEYHYTMKMNKYGKLDLQLKSVKINNHHSWFGGLIEFDTKIEGKRYIVEYNGNSYHIGFAMYGTGYANAWKGDDFEQNYIQKQGDALDFENNYFDDRHSQAGSDAAWVVNAQNVGIETAIPVMSTVWNGPVDYSDITDPKNAGAGKKFTQNQKAKILNKNREANGGWLRSDEDGTYLNPSQKGGNDPLGAEVDHKHSRSKGGSNSNSNAQVLSKKQNGKKSNK